MNIETKLCPRCSQEKSLTEFYYNQHKNRYATKCKSCTSHNTKKWQEKLFYSTNPKDMLEATFYKISQSSRSNAKTKRIEYSLSIQNLRDIYKNQEGKCFYTGIPMALRTIHHLDRDPLLISLDRYSSTLGYTKENTVFCCWGVNALKGYHSANTFYDTLKLLYESSKTMGKI